MIKCKVCNKDKNKKEFYGGNICKKCHRARQNDYRKNIPPKKYQFNHNKPWTEEDKEYLIEFQHLPNIELAYSLGRSIGTVASKKTELRRVKGIKKERGLSKNVH